MRDLSDAAAVKPQLFRFCVYVRLFLFSTSALVPTSSPPLRTYLSLALGPPRARTPPRPRAPRPRPRPRHGASRTRPWLRSRPLPCCRPRGLGLGLGPDLVSFAANVSVFAQLSASRPRPRSRPHLVRRGRTSATPSCAQAATSATSSCIAHTALAATSAAVDTASAFAQLSASQPHGLAASAPTLCRPLRMYRPLPSCRPHGLRLVPDLVSSAADVPRPGPRPATGSDSATPSLVHCARAVGRDLGRRGHGLGLYPSVGLGLGPDIASSSADVLRPDPQPAAGSDSDMSLVD